MPKPLPHRTPTPLDWLNGTQEHLNTVLDKQRAVCQIGVPCGWLTASISLVDICLTGQLAFEFASNWRSRAASAE